ncbi:hypothetical protein P12x_000175 [Tundrisphaera lichenicola]|uniref:hypothetical protein n=1 Tax=Tundrisphaera lichenicola TaxID=2029860 RepID=UPI003EBDAC2D
MRTTIMGLAELMIFALVLVLTTIAVPWLTFALASLFSGFPRLRLHQVLGIVGVSAWVLGFLASLGPSGGTELLVFFTTVVILLAFAGMWTREFRLLMLRRADEFPDRHDKLAWTFVLTVMAPAGVWLFGNFRKARWPEAIKADQPHPLDDPESSDIGVPAGFSTS